MNFTEKRIWNRSYMWMGNGSGLGLLAWKQEGLGGGKDGGRGYRVRQLESGLSLR